TANGLSVSNNKVPKPDTTLSCRRHQFDLSVKREQRRHAVRGRGGITQVSGDGRDVLNLNRPNLARGLFQDIKAWRQFGSRNFAPRNPAAYAHPVVGHLNDLELLQTGKVE